MKNNIFIISGPSGAGEDSIIEGLRKTLPIERLITTTTRKMRPSDKQGKPYFFISKEKFLQGVKNKNFLEYAKEYNNNYYGITHKEINRIKNSNKIGILKIEYKGVMAVKKIMPKIKSILINAPLKIMAKRIKRRDNTTDEYVQERMEYTKEWLKYRDIYDYEVINEENKLNKAIKDVAQIIKTNIDKK